MLRHQEEQVPQRPDNRNRKQQQQPSAEFLEVLKYEMALTSETMNQELSELQIMGYVEALAGMSIEKLRAGFKRARRTLQFFPKPVEVHELALDEIEETTPKQYFLPEAEPEWSEEDRKKWLEEIRIACGGKTILPAMTEQQVNERREVLRQQRDQLLGKK